MASESLNRSPQSNRPDLLSAVISNLAVIIQIVAVGAVGLADVLKINSFFQFKDLVILANFIILLLSFSSIGIYSFYKSNKNFSFENLGVITKLRNWFFGKRNPLNNQGEKNLLLILYLFLILSAFVFFLSNV